MVRVLFSSSDGLGHVQPMIPLARAVQQRGHDVAWLTAGESLAWLEQFGFVTFRGGWSAAELDAEYHSTWPLARELRGSSIAAHRFPRLYGELAAPRTFEALTDVVESWLPDLIVHDATELASPAVAAGAGIPHATHALGPPIPRERLAAASDVVAPLWASVGMPPRANCGLYDDLYIDTYPSSLSNSDAGPFDRLVRHRPEAGDAAAGERLPLELANALRFHPNRPTVYVTFGAARFDPASMQPVIDAMHRIDATVVVTVGPSGDLDAFGVQPDNVHLLHYLPQSLILPHCSAVISHGGSGVVLAGLGRGLPQLCIPQSDDQFVNAQACVASGAGLALVDDDASVDRIEHAVHALLDQPAFRTSALRVRDEIAMMPSVGDVAGVLETLTVPLSRPVR